MLGAMTDARDRSELERLALAEWSPAAGARIESVTVVDDRAEVVVRLGPGYDDFTYFQRGDDGAWHEIVSGNGPTVGWDDPAQIEW